MAVLLLCLMSLMLACAPRIQGAADVTPLVRAIRFQGNHGGLDGAGDLSLRSAMEQPQSQNLWWLAPRRRAARLDLDALKLDGWRIETWYAHHGYFDARFLGWDVITRKRGRNRVPVVKIIGRVEEGEPSLVRSVTWEGMGVIGAPMLGQLDRQRPLREGDRFTMEAAQDTQSMALSKLQERGFARAKMEMSVDAWPVERAVDVRFSSEPGVVCTFGDVVVTGVARIKPELIEDELVVTAGKPFRASQLSATQRNLFALGTFSLVNVVPDLGAWEDGSVPENIVPVKVQLEESQFRQVRLGGGAAVENGSQELRVVTDFKHVNLFNRLWRLDVSGKGGYRWLTHFEDLISGASGSAQASSDTAALAGGPIALASVELGVPRFPARQWRFDNAASLELGLEEYYQFITPEFSSNLTWRLSRRWSLAFGLNFRYYDYINSVYDYEQLKEEVGSLDFSDPFTLTWLSQRGVYDSRDNQLNTKYGAYAMLGLAEAGPPGLYDYLRLEGEGRLYRPLGKVLNHLFGWFPRAVFATRAGGGYILPYGLIDPERATVPLAERLYLGGSSSVRGWLNDHLGPFVLNASSDGESAEVVPIGGLVSAFGSAELRGEFAGTYGVVLFTDVGMVWADTSQMREILPIPSVGLGLRYITSVGPVRLDVARRLGDLEGLDDFPYQIYLSLSEAF